jgi:protocatechuate 3,4-dioxygenase beta subunit
MHVIEPARCTYYIDEIVFTDDSRLTAEQRKSHPGRGGSGIVTPKRDSTGTWLVTRDIVLGQAIPGYPR